MDDDAAARAGTRRRPRARTSALALLVALLCWSAPGCPWRTTSTCPAGRPTTWPSLPGPCALLLVLAGSLPLTFRRIAPLPVLALTAVASLAYQALGPAARAAADRRARRPLHRRGPAAAAGRQPGRGRRTCVAFTVGGADRLGAPHRRPVLHRPGVGGGHGDGRATASRSATPARPWPSSATAELAREQETRTQAAVAQEQARIAREVHDIVAHDVSVMVAQAGAARRVFADQPQVAADALGLHRGRRPGRTGRPAPPGDAAADRPASSPTGPRSPPSTGCRGCSSRSSAPVCR